MKKAVVTGANGFVGAAVCHALEQHGVEIIAVLRDESSNKKRIEDLKNVRIVYCTMDNYKELPKMLKNENPDVFYHFAWTGSAGHLRGNANVQLANIGNSCDALRAAKEMGCNRFVFAGSIMEYEIQKLMNTSKTVGINSLYSTAKHTANYMLRIIADDISLEYTSGVISNIYGPGEYSPRLINTTIRSLIRGEHCSFSSGEQNYDFIYIDDAAEAFWLIGNKKNVDKYYYIGTENPKPLKDFLIELRDIVNSKNELGLGELSFGGISLDYDELDVHKIYKELGFEMHVSFQEGIRRTMKWIKEEGENAEF